MRSPKVSPPEANMLTRLFRKLFTQRESQIRWISFFVILGSVGFCYYTSQKLGLLKTSYSIRQFMPENHFLLKRDDTIRDRFLIPMDQPLLAIVTLGEQSGGTWLEPAVIAKLKQATAEIELLDGVRSALTLATVPGATETEEGLSVGPLLDQIAENRWKERVLKDPLITPRLISQNEKTTLVVMNLESDDPGLSHKVRESSRAVLERFFPNENVQLGGVPSIQSELGRLLTSELGNLCLFALLAAVIALFAVFTNILSVIIPLYISLVSIFAVLLVMIATDTPFTVISSTLPILISTTVVSMATHTMIRFAKDMKIAQAAGTFKSRIMQTVLTMRALFLPNLLTALTTCVGFMALTTTDSPLISQYGFTVGYAVMISWLVTMVLLPPFLNFMPTPRIRSWTQASSRWAFFVMKHRKVVFASSVALALLLGYKGFDLNWSPRLFDDLPANQEARVSTEQIDRTLGGMISLQIVIDGKYKDYWVNPENIQKLDQLSKEWRDIAAVGSVVSIADFANAAAFYNSNLISTAKGVAETFFMYSLSNNNPLNPYMTADAQEARIAVRLHDVPAEELEATMFHLKLEAQKAFPRSFIQLGGVATTAHQLHNQLAATLIYGFWQALLFISVLLLIIFRSWRWTLVAVLPNLVPPLGLLGFLAYGETPIKPGIALIFSIALGLAFNNTVYMLGRLRSLYLSGKYVSPPIAKTLYKEGMPCFLSTISLLAGFAAFTASYFSMNQNFGIYMLASIFMGLIGDLLLLPTMISLFPKLLPAPASLVAKTKNTAAVPDTLEATAGNRRYAFPSAVVAVFSALFFIMPLNSTAKGDCCKIMQDNARQNDLIAAKHSRCDVLNPKHVYFLSNGDQVNASKLAN